MNKIAYDDYVGPEAAKIASNVMEGLSHDLKDEPPPIAAVAMGISAVACMFGLAANLNSRLDAIIVRLSEIETALQEQPKRKPKRKPKADAG